MAGIGFDLERFVHAQGGGVVERAIAELRRGRKQGHWMWFVFPQIAGLGRSPTAQAYAIGSLEEARAYLAHPVLGPRLRECASALLGLPGADAESVLGPVDAMKLRSSMTLFARAAEEPGASAAAGDTRAPGELTVFAAVLERYFDGQPDRRTLDLLAAGARSTTR